MEKVVVSVCGCGRYWYALVCACGYDYTTGRKYTTRWSAKRGVRRFMKALGATNWRFADEPETEAVAEPAVKGVHPWARWEATDRDGKVFEYQNQPSEGHLGSWWIDFRNGASAPVRSVSGPVENWRETKRRVNV